MNHHWRPIYDFWFPPSLDDGDLGTHRQMFFRWFAGGASSELPVFSPVLEAAQAGQLGGWLAEPLARLSLIIVLDQFPRGLFADRPEAYASDADALRIAEEGLRNGHYDALSGP